MSNDPPHYYDITNSKCDISILSESSINLIMKMVVNFSRYPFTKQHRNTWINTYTYLTITHHSHCTSKLQDESRLIQRSFYDNKGDDKKLKGQVHFMITKMMISRIKEWIQDVQDWIKNTSRFKRKFGFKIQASKN